MKIAVVTEATPALAAVEIDSQLCPFFRMMPAVSMVVSSSATCSGPLVASRPNKAMDAEISTASVTSGNNASKYEGSRMPVG